MGASLCARVWDMQAAPEGFRYIELAPAFLECTTCHALVRHQVNGMHRAWHHRRDQEHEILWTKHVRQNQADFAEALKDPMYGYDD